MQANGFVVKSSPCDTVYALSAGGTEENSPR
jgi:hypothetical protein